MSEPLITVGCLRRQLEGLPEDKPIYFGCPELEFYRVKDRGDAIQIEFNQTVYADKRGKVIVNDHSGE